MELYLTGRTRLQLPDNREFTPQDMPIETVLRALDVAADNRGAVMMVKGNEPLLYPQLEQLFASAKKRKQALVFETVGLVPTLARNLIKENCRFVTLKLYRPELYRPEDLAERDETVNWWLENNVVVQPCVIVDNLEADYSWTLEVVKKLQVREMMFRLPCRRPQASMRPFVVWYMSQLAECLKHGLRLMLDCGIRLCAFTDEEFGVYSKLGNKFGECVPHCGVTPDGNVAHCWEMIPYPGQPIGTFRNSHDLLQYYYDVFNELQCEEGVRFPGCPDCLSRAYNICMGPSMATKAESVMKEFNVLKELFKKEEEGGKALMEEKERMDNLWRLGMLSMEMALYADAVECYEEMRSLHPEHWNIHFMLAQAYWEAGRVSEGEDEFRKAARLMASAGGSQVDILLELHKHLVRNGNSIKARLLQSEIQKLQAEEKQKKLEKQSVKA